MVGDFRSLIEFCKSFEHHKNMATAAQSDDVRTKKQLRSLTHSSALCENFPAAIVDLVILSLVMAACFFLLRPYFVYICSQTASILPAAVAIIGDLLCELPLPYVICTILMLICTLCGLELYNINLRKCGKPRCRGLKKAVEFDIQLESNGFVKSSPASSLTAGTDKAAWMKEGLDIGKEHKELEAELRRMAPLNGRAVLVFRSPCGCPRACMEVWGAKKPRKLKK